MTISIISMEISYALKIHVLYLLFFSFLFFQSCDLINISNPPENLWLTNGEIYQNRDLSRRTVRITGNDINDDTDFSFFNEIDSLSSIYIYGTSITRLDFLDELEYLRELIILDNFSLSEIVLRNGNYLSEEDRKSSQWIYRDLRIKIGRNSNLETIDIISTDAPISLEVYSESNLKNIDLKDVSAIQHFDVKGVPTLKKLEFPIEMQFLSRFDLELMNSLELLQLPQRLLNAHIYIAIV